MEKINIAEILKNCPKGMELDCTIYDNVKLNSVVDKTNYPIKIDTKCGFSTRLTKYGQNVDSKDAKCVIFPKGKTTWEGFRRPFKVGDRVKSIFSNCQYIITEVTDTHYTLVEVINKFQYTEPIVEDKNWELVPNKFDISTLIPFESKVLVRNHKNHLWKPVIFGGCVSNNIDGYNYIVLGGFLYKHLIPYEGNEHLIGKTDDCNDFYKTWE